MASNAQRTEQIVSQLAREQPLPDARHRVIPRHLAQSINAFVGKNYLGTAAELLYLAKQARAKIWMEFFTKELVPAAEKGCLHVEFYPAAPFEVDHWFAGIKELQYFQDFNGEEELVNLAWENGVWFECTYDNDGYIDYCSFSWSDDCELDGDRETEETIDDQLNREETVDC
eukprot:TRINITY_DN76014_c0_g1_i1.p1 TRINITY_DN76014_c0_g1~~TRINITY_DN76014_c0_g1_i1.p1  ORF type:complete len:172 (-),score=32.02 TRINITY_DN76014_c0_g1_i1:544-1059(-)